MTGSLRQPALVVVAVLVVFGLSLQRSPESSLAVLAGTVALGAAAYANRRRMGKAISRTTLTGALLGGVVVFSLVTAMGWSPAGIGPTSGVLETLPAAGWVGIALFVYMRGDTARRRIRAVVVGVTVTLAAIVGVAHVSAAEGIGLDVLTLHIEAADALERGLNPYTDAVTVDNGAPTAEPGDVIEGYVYPPVTAILYAIGQWSFSDPRYTSLIAWLIFLVAMGVFAVKQRGRSALLIIVLMASIPAWPFVLRAAWTEPVSLALAALAFSWWHRSTLSGLVLGMTLGSKQYFFVAAPILALYRGSHWWRRSITALLAIAVMVGAALLWNFSAFWSAAVEFHLATPPRIDSMNLIGLLADYEVDWDIPPLLPIAIGLIVSVVTGIGTHHRTEWFLALASTMAASFAVSSQAFLNYWFLITGLCGIALLGMTADQDSALSAQRVSERESSAGEAGVSDR